MLPVQYQQSFDRFRHEVDQTFCPMAIEPRNPASAEFDFDLSCNRLGQTSVASVTSGPIEVVRTPQKVSLASDAFYLVKFQLHGNGVLRQRGREAYLQPGDYSLASTAEPYQLDFDGDYKQAVLVCPQQLLKDYVHDPDYYLCRSISPESGMPAVLTEFVKSVIANHDNLELPLLQRLESQMLELLVMALQQKTHERASITANRSAEKLAEVKQFVLRHLHRTNLKPQLIASSVGISLRYLHSLFESEDLTISNYIKVERLQRARRILSEDNRRSVTDIALDVGFCDVSHFNRCFKKNFKCTPSEIRASQST